MMRRMVLLLLLTVLLLLGTAVSQHETESENDDDGEEGKSRSDTVVFDIDGTITYSSWFGVNVRRKSRAAMSFWLDLGYQVVIVTARSQALEWYTTSFLSMWRFPLDQVLEIVFAPETLDTDEEKIAYKTTALTNLALSWDLNLMYAYGDSTTDFEAYANAGLSADRVFALKRYWETKCQEGAWTECMQDYTNHLNYIADQPPLL